MKRLLLSAAMAALSCLPAAALADEKGAYLILESFTAPVPRTVAWDVLTDYGHLNRFVSSIKESKVMERDGRSLLLEQTSTGRFFFLKRHIRVLLRVSEDPPRAITFHDVSKMDFAEYEGAWELKETPGGTEVTYRLKARPNFPAPAWFIGGIFKSTVKDLLKEVRAEVLSRRK